MAPACRAEGIAVVGYSPFGLGTFPPSPAAGAVLDGIARAHGATRRQIALAFLVRDPHTFTLAKAATPAHTTENAAAATIALSDAEAALIAAVCPLPADDSGLPDAPWTPGPVRPPRAGQRPRPRTRR